MPEFEFSRDWGYSEKERATARATALRIIAEAHGQTLASQLPKIIEWYAGSPHEEDARELLDALHERLWNANDSLTDTDYEDEEEYEKAWEDATVDTETKMSFGGMCSLPIPLRSRRGSSIWSGWAMHRWRRKRARCGTLTWETLPVWASVWNPTMCCT